MKVASFEEKGVWIDARNDRRPMTDDGVIILWNPERAMKMPGTHTNYKCALCGRRIRSGKGSSSFTRDNFCQKCGQAIDWSEE